MEKRKNKTNQQQDEKAFEQSPNSTDSSIQPMGTDDQFIDNDVLKLLAITDELLGKLPEDAISDFASSEDFELYKKVMTKYNILK